MKSKIDNTAILVLSCDSYSDLWDPFIYFFNKNWVDCKMDKYILSNHKHPKEDSGFNSLLVGVDKSWSDGLYKALKRLANYDYVFLFMEDAFICETVDNKKIEDIMKKFFICNGNFLTFIREPAPNKDFNDYFGYITNDSFYRPTATFSLWKKDILMKLIDRNENAWEFEKKGKIRSEKFENFFAVYNDCFKSINTVIKGMWNPSAVLESEKLGYRINTEGRTFYPSINFKYLVVYKLIRKIFLFIMPKSISKLISNFRWKK